MAPEGQPSRFTGMTLHSCRPHMCRQLARNPVAARLLPPQGCEDVTPKRQALQRRRGLEQERRHVRQRHHDPEVARSATRRRSARGFARLAAARQLLQPMNREADIPKGPKSSQTLLRARQRWRGLVVGRSAPQ
eukprot:155960-Prymnesium_polylepis.1